LTILLLLCHPIYLTTILTRCATYPVDSVYIEDASWFKSILPRNVPAIVAVIADLVDNNLVLSRLLIGGAKNVDWPAGLVYHSVS